MDEQSRSDLGARFDALPHELRAHVFAFLLVRPVKWDLLHLESCVRSSSKTTSDYTRPSHHSLVDPDNSYICASCGPDTHERNWRHAFERGFEVYISPWRSRWAAAQTNPYICTNCYDDRWRARPFPEPTNLPCLCARRRNLEARLVCRQWNKEASIVFFSDNTFAFDDCIAMENFFSAIPRRWKTLITRVSLLLPLWRNDSGVDLLDSPLCVLDKLTWLQYLELDAKLLNKETTVSALLSCDIPSLHKVRFVAQRPYKDVLWRRLNPPTYIWGELEDRMLFTGGLPEYVARSIKPQSSHALRTHETTRDDVQRQKQLYDSIQNDTQLCENNHLARTVDCGMRTSGRVLADID
jgi:hypothetical protein